MMISYQELVRTFPKLQKENGRMLGMLCAFACITVLEPLRCRELPLSEKPPPYNSNQWSLLIGLCTGMYFGTAVAHRQYIQRFLPVDLSLPGNTPPKTPLFGITNMDVNAWSPHGWDIWRGISVPGVFPRYH
nr:hypothetical protein [Klebsiella pneumoniae]